MASGGIGTAANLEDTQVLRTTRPERADSRGGIPQPGIPARRDDQPDGADEHAGTPTPAPVGGGPRSAAARPRTWSLARTLRRAARPAVGVFVGMTAGVAVGVLVLVILMSTVGSLGSVDGGGLPGQTSGGAMFELATAAPPTEPRPTSEGKAGGKGKCNDRGHDPCDRDDD